MRYFLSVILVLLLASQAWGATLYLNPTGSATSPYDTREKAANTWAQIAAVVANDDTVYVSGTNNTTISIGGFSGLTIMQDPGQAAAVINGSTTDAHVLNTNSAISCVIEGIRFTSAYAARRVAYLRGTGTIIDNCVFDTPSADNYTIEFNTSVGETIIRSVVAGGADRGAIDSQNNPSFTIQLSTIYNTVRVSDSDYPIIRVAGTGVVNIFNNYIFGAGACVSNSNTTITSTISNNILGPCGINGPSYNTYIIQDFGATATILAKNNTIIPPILNSSITPLSYIFSANVTDGGGNINYSPLFKNDAHAGYFIFGVDDSDHEYTLDLADLAEDYNTRLTWWVNHKTYYEGVDRTDEDRAEMRAAIVGLASRGHDIASHAWSHSDLSDLRGMTIKYTGTGGAALTIDPGVSFSVDAGDNQYDVSITFTATDGIENETTYTKCADIIDALEAAGDGNGYTVAMYGVNADSTERQKGHAQATSLAAVTAQDITSEYTMLFDFDLYKVDEIDDAVAWLESVSGTNVVSFAAPYGAYSTDMKAYLETKFESIRGGSDAVEGTAWHSANLRNLDLGEIAVGAGSEIFGPEGTFTDAEIIQRAEWVSSKNTTGSVTIIFAHNATEVAVDTWNLILGAMSDEVEIMTQREFSDFIRDESNGWTNTEDFVYTKDLGTPDFNFALQSDSPAINTGTPASTVSLTGKWEDISGNEYSFTPYDTLNIGPDQSYSRAAERPTSGGVIWGGSW
ncbi:MAG: hypothetical protein M0R74_19650 [Dehalococcoidia bacterium]|nr:hypothetical protein [Dehalococcoidia bacterium]